MTVAWLVAAVHLIAFGVGTAAIAVRARVLRRMQSLADAGPVFRADTWWGVSGILLLATGLWRAFGNLEKGSDYYLAHPLFHAKLGLVAVIILLEVWPMVSLLRWRRARRQGAEADLSGAAAFARISTIQLGLLFVIVVLATAIARGIGR